MKTKVIVIIAIVLAVISITGLLTFLFVPGRSGRAKNQNIQKQASNENRQEKEGDIIAEEPSDSEINKDEDISQSEEEKPEEEKIAVLPTDLKITKEVLISSPWGPSDGSFGMWLNFKADDTYSIVFAGEGGGQHIEGTYSIEENKLILTKKKEFLPEVLPPKLLHDRTVWQLEEDSENLYFLFKIVSDTDYSFWMKGSSVPDGEERMVENHKIITYNRTETPLTEDTPVFLGPGIEYEKGIFVIPGPDMKEKPQLPKDWKISVLGRTDEEVSIEEKTDYWYYCKTEIGWYGSGPRFGWIFGSYLTMIN